MYYLFAEYMAAAGCTSEGARADYRVDVAAFEALIGTMVRKYQETEVS